MITHAVSIGSVTMGAGKPLVLIAGPCVIENETSSLKHAERLKTICTDIGIPLIFKSSYDKANRTSAACLTFTRLSRLIQRLKSSMCYRFPRSSVVRPIC